MKTVEEKILGAVWVLVLNGMNDVLENIDDDVPALEKRGSALAGDCVKRPVSGSVGLEKVERTEKERIVRLDAYRVVVTITASESDCYRYAYALEKAIGDDVTLCGVAENVLFENKVYTPKMNLVEAEFSLRILIFSQLNTHSELQGWFFKDIDNGVFFARQ
jgi:hypothetical protein